MNKESNMNQNQLEYDRDYWKAQHMKLKGQIQFFVGWTLVCILIITVELIINRYWPVPLH